MSEPKFADLTRSVVADIASVSPHTEVVVHKMTFTDPWDLQEVYEKLFDFTKGYKFQPEKEDYLIHLTTGTHVAQICWFLLNEAHFIPGRLLQTSLPSQRGQDSSAGRIAIIDLDLSKYDRLSTRFAEEQERTLDFLKSGIATTNKGFNQLIEQIELVSINSRAPMLIMGPTGAGKFVLASRIYDLRKARAGLAGRFVEVNCATLPSLAERREDIAANLDFELDRFARSHRRQVRFNKEARDLFLKFARSPETSWNANFRDLNAAVTRMATLAPKGRITVGCVLAEVARLKTAWTQVGVKSERPLVFSDEQWAEIDPFDRVQLDYVLKVCHSSKTLSDAGRKLFSVSREKKAKSNDADRLKKYLARFGLSWAEVSVA
jgi:sigma54-dependent transcription regulator